MIHRPMHRLCRRPLFLLLGALLSASVLADAPKLQGNAIETPKHVFTVAPSGLPAQIVIKADRGELPLAFREGGAEPPAPQLQALDRGPQLRAPMRLVARVAGKDIVAEPKKPAKPDAKGDAVVCKTDLQADAVELELECRYAADGSLAVELEYEAGAEIESLALVIDLAGAVDTVIAGPPVEPKLRAYQAAEFALPATEGRVWGNAKADARDGRVLPGVVTRCFLGNGGRGFTFETEGPKGFTIDEAVSMMTVERDATGAATWAIRFVNRPGQAKGRVAFRLLTHPEAPRPANARQAAWLQLEQAEGVHLVQGPAGGDALSFEQDSAATYPAALFRFLVGTHTGTPARVVPNSRQLAKAGMDRRIDRSVLGRALLHDVGIDPRGLAHLGEARKLVAALQQFGYFAADGQTEYIPYWRNQGLLRYGPPFERDSDFEMTAEDPLAKVRVSAYLRPRTDGVDGYRVLFVVVNDSDREVRDRLYVTSLARIFSGVNVQPYQEVIGSYDYSVVPAGDWAKESVLAESRRGHEGDFVLRDVEDNGTVSQAESNNPAIDIYGPLYLRPHDFRVFAAYGGPRPVDPKKPKK